MNIIRCVDVNHNAMCGAESGEGALIDFEYTQDEEKNFKCVDVRVYFIINSVVSKKMPINIIDKLVIAKEMLRYLESEKESK
jgi:hypothetical protein